jgi:hypothetical protein
VALVLLLTHLCLGWKKLVPADAMQFPRDHQQTVIYIGWTLQHLHLCMAQCRGMYINQKACSDERHCVATSKVVGTPGFRFASFCYVQKAVMYS